MLAFDPNQRITVEEALAHPYLAQYHNPAWEPACEHFNFDFDRHCVSLADIKSIKMIHQGH